MEFTTKQGQRVVCDSIAAFLQIHEQYFPETEIRQWKIVGDGMGTTALHSLAHSLRKSTWLGKYLTFKKGN